MNALFWRDLIAEIKKSWNRFLSIFAIAALGVGFIAGMKATAPAMRQTAELYFSRQNFMDFRLVSALGFTKSDADAVRNLPGVREAQATYTADMLIQSADGLKNVRIHALQDNGARGINRPILTEGCWPQNDSECVLDFKQAGVLGTIGSSIVLSDANGADKLGLLRHKTYTITGFVKTPEYIDFATRGDISIGDNAVYCFLYIPVESFQSDYYTDILIRADNSAQYASYSDGYDVFSAEMKDTLTAFARRQEAVSFAEISADLGKKLEEARQKLSQEKRDAGAKLSEAKSQLDSAAAQLSEAAKKIQEAEQQLDSASTALSGNQSALTGTQSTLEAAQAELAAKHSAYNQGMDALNDGKASLDAIQKQIDEALSSGALKKIVALKAQAKALAQELAVKEAALADAKGKLDAADAEMQNRTAELAAETSHAQLQLASSQKQLDDGKTALAKMKSDYAAAQTDLEKSKSDYEASVQQANDKRAEAEEKLSELQEKYDALKKPTWLVFRRSDNPDYAAFGADINRVNALTSVFPVFFYLIAALVCLTTLARMVEEQRTQIGVLRALGYSKAAVASKYLIYAGAAGLLGSAAGVSWGYAVLPHAIYHTYESTYTLIPLVMTVNIPYATGLSLIAVLVMMLSAFMACRREVASVPSVLMRPRAPLQGSRVLLERIPFIWKRVSFFVKVTVRNLVRYKKRFFLTVLGIGGCTALMLAAFGMRDSISGTIPRQYYGLHSYNLFLKLVSPASGSDRNALNSNLQKNLTEFLYVTQLPLTVEGMENTSAVYLTVPEDERKLKDFIQLKDPVSGGALSYPSPSKVIITEKIAGKLGLRAGDRITFRLKDGDFITETVGGVTENYVYNYIYMTPEDYTAAYGRAPEYDFILGKAPNGDSMSPKDEKTLSDRFSGEKNVLYVTLLSSIRREFDTAMQNLDAMVSVIIVCACLLALIVLYNLMNINITERTREIAMLKALGFLPNEVSAYLNREVVVLTLIGIALGLIGGTFLHGFAIRTAEVDMLMYVRSIKPQSYIMSAVLAFLFSLAVNVLIRLRLRRIDMVETLKSAE